MAPSSKRLKKYLNPSLLSYQRKGVLKAYRFILKNPTHSTYNASEMGTGKTVMSIEVLNLLKRFNGLSRTLIVSPACMEYTWEEELKKWLRFPATIEVLSSGKKFTEENLEADICITSYGLLRSRNFEYARLLGAKKFDNIIYDEAHALKNTKTLQTKAAFYLWDLVKTKQALSGTPFLANIVDGYSLFHRMAPEHFPDFNSFVDDYSFRTLTPWAIKYFGVKHPKRLRKIIRSNFYFRYTLEDGKEELPEVQWIRVNLPKKYSVKIELDEQIQKYLKSLEEMLFNPEAYVPPPLTPALAAHRRLQGERTVKPVTEFSKNILDQGSPLVIFGWHKDVLREYARKLKKYKPRLITGDTSPLMRHKHQSDFQSGEARLLVVNFKAGGYGLTFTRGHIGVCAELDWNPGTLAQAAGRFRRYGQKKKVQMYYFPSIKSIDEQVINVVKSKASAFNKVM
jgi:SWI/SNF-related matrix-associated actin-dependent regulator 1 of chromatin subfamily A